MRDQAEFETHAMPYASSLYRTAVRLLDSSSSAEHAVEETYLAAWKVYGQKSRGADCKAWMYRILFDVMRRPRLRLVQPAPVSAPSGDAVLAALDRLPPAWRAVLLLVDVEDFSPQEASEILGIPVAQVTLHLDEAHAALERELGPAEPEAAAATR